MMLNSEGMLITLPGDLVCTSLPLQLHSPPVIESRVLKRIEIDDGIFVYLDIYENGALSYSGYDNTPVCIISYIDNFFYIKPQHLNDKDYFAILLAISRYINRYMTEAGEMSGEELMRFNERQTLNENLLEQVHDRNNVLLAENIKMASELSILRKELAERQKEDLVYLVETEERIELEIPYDAQTVQDSKEGNRVLSEEEREGFRDDLVRFLLELSNSESDRTD